METTITSSVTSAQEIARLTAELEHARQRARVAEEQLHRVHRAVRAFKQSQIAARQAAAKAAFDETPKSSGVYQSWATTDPSLDDRFQEFLDGGTEPDRARKWMLEEG